MLSRKITSALVAIALVFTMACAGQSKNNTTWVDMQEADNKADLKKAALLNIELGETYLQQGQVSRAKKKLLHALELAPYLPEAHASLGYFFEKVGDNKMAEKYYRKSIFLGKEKGFFHNHYGIYLCAQGRYKEADKEFNLAAKDYHYPKTADVYENAGLCALKANDLVKAENYFKSSVRYDPKQTSALMELTELTFKRGDLVQAQNYLHGLRSQSDPSPRLLWLAIQIAQQTKDQDAVASNALLLKNLFVHSKEYKLYLASIEQPQ